MFPDTLLIDCSEEIREFYTVFVDGLDMPSLVDLDATVCSVFEGLIQLANIDNEITLVALRVAESEPLFENLEWEHETREAVFAAVRRLAQRLKNKLLTLHVYSNGYFPYTFRTLLHDHTVVFSKIPDSPGSIYQPRL